MYTYGYATKDDICNSCKKMYKVHHKNNANCLRFDALCWALLWLGAKRFVYYVSDSGGTSIRVPEKQNWRIWVNESYASIKDYFIRPIEIKGRIYESLLFEYNTSLVQVMACRLLGA